MELNIAGMMFGQKNMTTQQFFFVFHIGQYTKQSLLKPLCQLEQYFTFCYDKTENISAIGIVTYTPLLFHFYSLHE